MIKIKEAAAPLRVGDVVRRGKRRLIVTAVTKPVTKSKGGRPKRYETAAERQKAYRDRRKANGR